MFEPLNREPLTVAIGDALWFRRWLPEFPVEAGWFLEYTILDEKGAVLVPLFPSVKKPQYENEASHEVQINPFGVAPNVVVNPSNFCRLVGYVTNNVYRHQIYDGRLAIVPNFALNQAQETAIPFDLRMIRLYEHTLEELAKHSIHESDMQRMKFVRETREAIRTELGFHRERYQNYLNHQATVNGRPDPTLIRPQFMFF